MIVKEITINPSLQNQSFTIEIDTDTTVEVSISTTSNGILAKIVENDVTLFESSPIIDKMPIMLPIRAYNFLAISSIDADVLSVADFGKSLSFLLVQNA